MILLALESSCDETAAAVVRNGREILSSVVSTQTEHRRYSGVVPELASRAHTRLVNGIVSEALRSARVKDPRTLDGIAVTVGPGLVGSLLVGRMVAEALGWAWGVPVYGANHLEGHLLSPLLAAPHVKPPFLGLVVSGGHTELVHARTLGDFHLLGRTRDDAAGEAFDKVAKMMKLGYPGGPVVDRLARTGRAEKAAFPRPWLPGTWDFSFSGLKTAALYRLRTKSRWSPAEKRDLCAGFQEAVVEVLAGKSVAAAVALNVKAVVVGGGVASNSRLRTVLPALAAKNGIEAVFAPPALCTDNAAMIAAAVDVRLRGRRMKAAPLKVNPQMHIPFAVKPPRAPHAFPTLN